MIFGNTNLQVSFNSVYLTIMIVTTTETCLSSKAALCKSLWLRIQSNTNRYYFHYKICHVELQYFTAAPQPCSMQPRSCYYLTMRENSTMPSTGNNARYNKMELIHTICLSQLVSQSFVMLDATVKCSHIFMTSYIRVCLVVFQLQFRTWLKEQYLRLTYVRQL